MPEIGPNLLQLLQGAGLLSFICLCLWLCFLD